MLTVVGAAAALDSCVALGTSTTSCQHGYQGRSCLCALMWLWCGCGVCVGGSDVLPIIMRPRLTDGRYRVCVLVAR